MGHCVLELPGFSKDQSRDLFPCALNSALKFLSESNNDMRTVLSLNIDQGNVKALNELVLFREQHSVQLDSLRRHGGQVAPVVRRNGRQLRAHWRRHRKCSRVFREHVVCKTNENFISSQIDLTSISFINQICFAKQTTQVPKCEEPNSNTIKHARLEARFTTPTG